MNKVQEVTDIVFSMIQNDLLEADKLTASNINTIWFSGGMTTYEDALEVFSAVQDEFIYY